MPANDAQVATRLSARTLADLDPRISIPTYDRGALLPGIVHIGVGGFHRAHQAVYLDELARAGVANWSITGAGVMRADHKMAEALSSQDHLYSLITRDRAGTDVRVIGSIVDYVLAAGDPEALVSVLASPATRIVSLTVTEGGYPVDEATGDYVPAPDGTLPRAFEVIARAAARRKQRRLPGFTVASCDNVMHNGRVARTATMGVAREIGTELSSWIEDNVAFPNAMVDRITPVTDATDRELLRKEYSLIDRWPVASETFIQWVIEDDYPRGRPPYEDAGAIITTDVTPYETLKLRLLNASHSSIAYLSALLGHRFVHEAMADPAIAGFLEHFLAREATPSLPDVPGIDVDDYRKMVIERFANPAVGDQIMRLCMDGSSKFPKFLMPTIAARLDAGRSVTFGALAIAGWCQYLLGTDATGASIDIASDPHLDAAIEFAEASLSNPAAFLGFRDGLSDRVASDPVFRAAFVESLRSLRSVGVESTLMSTGNAEG